MIYCKNTWKNYTCSILAIELGFTFIQILQNLESKKLKILEIIKPENNGRWLKSVENLHQNSSVISAS